MRIADAVDRHAIDSYGSSGQNKLCRLGRSHGGKSVRRKLLAFINMKALAFAVVAPVIALGSVSGYIIANQKRLWVEQTVEQSVGATLNAAERQLSKHLAAAEILASMA